MFNIDLSFYNCNSDMFDHKYAESKCNQLYHSFVSSNLKNGVTNISGCLACGMEYQNRTPFDDRNILEVICSGLLGCHFCEQKNGSQLEFAQDDFVLVQNEDITEVAKIYEGGEIVRIRRQKLGLFGEELPEIVRKLNDEDMNKVMVFGAAKWSLTSNAIQHKKVYEALKTELAVATGKKKENILQIVAAADKELNQAK